MPVTRNDFEEAVRSSSRIEFDPASTQAEIQEARGHKFDMASAWIRDSEPAAFARLEKLLSYERN